jgi:hypothetical protein
VSDLRVQLIHGLEGSPQGAKAQYLRRYFDVNAPSMDTGDFPACVAIQRAALEASPPDVLVGSSFGGGVAVALLAGGAWRGPTLLLAPAVGYLGLAPRLPEGVPVVIVHGARDALVPIEDSRVLAATGTRELVRLIEVDDEHRLTSLLEDERLASWIRSIAS